MAILGYNTKGAGSYLFATGLKFASSFVLASPQTLTELHGWFGGSGANAILYIYDDSAGSPNNRLAYTSPLALTGADVELSQSGFSVALAAGTYWIGFVSDGAGTSGKCYRDTTGTQSLKGVASGATFNPPSDPFGTATLQSTTRVLSVWGVVGAAPSSSFVPRVVSVT